MRNYDKYRWTTPLLFALWGIFMATSVAWAILFLQWYLPYKLALLGLNILSAIALLWLTAFGLKEVSPAKTKVSEEP